MTEQKHTWLHWNDVFFDWDIFQIKAMYTPIQFLVSQSIKPKSPKMAAMFFLVGERWKSKCCKWWGDDIPGFSPNGFHVLIRICQVRIYVNAVIALKPVVLLASFMIHNQLVSFNPICMFIPFPHHVLIVPHMFQYGHIIFRLVEGHSCRWAYVNKRCGGEAGDVVDKHLVLRLDVWGFIELVRMGLHGKKTSGKHTKSYWTWPFTVDLPTKNCDFP